MEKYKKRLIESKRHMPFGCSIPNLPPGIKCLYRALTPSEIKKHESNHFRSIRTNKNTKARFHEVSDVDEEKTSNQISIPNLTAICGADGQVIYVDKEYLVNLMKTRHEEIKSGVSLNQSKNEKNGDIATDVPVNESIVAGTLSPSTSLEKESIDGIDLILSSPSACGDYITDNQNMPSLNAIFPNSTPP